MAKEFTAFCWDCGKTTVHKIIEREYSGVTRVVFGILTLGVSEAGNTKTGECTKCGRINKKT
jgi:hypothetical protein